MKRIYAIGDLHFSGGQDKPMDIFGDHWDDHKNKILKNWEELIKEDDLVLIPGDISWAMYLDDAIKDLELIHRLPGEKILLRGNHDYWWEKITYLNSLYNNMKFLQNNSFCYKDFCVCGSRGWLVPGNVNFCESDEKIYKRESVRLNLSLQSAQKDKPIIVMMHYPPFNEAYEDNAFTTIINSYNVKTVVYGHLHDDYSFSRYFKGVAKGVEYKLVSSDYLKFRPEEVEI
ncbi:MAG: metallophosphoesterase [Clostridia bacterium]